MKAKILALLVLMMVALSTIGYSYACWNSGVHISHCCNCRKCDVEFTKVATSDNEVDENVADVYAEIGKAKDKMEIRIIDSYPCYEAYVNFAIENTGDKPVHIDEISIEDYDEAALEIEMTNLIVCTWISPGETANGQLAIRTLHEAKQNWRYTFQAEIKVSCQPRRHPRTISFWKYEFRAALNRADKLHIPKEKLGCYLDQITIESDVFEFTGAQIQKFKQALGTLKASGSGMEAKLQAQLLGLWLNYVARYAEGYKLSEMTAYEIIQGSEAALANHQTGQYKYWKDLCGNFNKLG